MQYDEFKMRNRFDLEELIAFSYGTLVDDPPDGFNGRLPAPPFLMIDRIISIESNRNQGVMIAEQDVRFDAWFFQCHMPRDPVQPGCLCVDAIWQLLGFYCIWNGALGTGRALGSEEIFFNGQVRPFNKIVRHEIDIRRFVYLKQSGATIVIGNSKSFVDGQLIMEIKNARSGIFRDIAYTDYPRRSTNSVGGAISYE
ncbi:MAG: bifunctional 3-hydroxydecanoyl-ACP dehydratase/trans-2-decenoyl-ACP isomerase [Deltaproteobacteria bacterium]|nr:bifunctional 3-hydroxydecanoyl-ACP dehydratase/trans-2-decenoyl-ACP isomerase [Deltaproteobacteria bacterium]